MKRDNYVTNIRTAIDGVFALNKSVAFTPLEIEDSLKSLGVKVNKTTVYRYLNHQTVSGNLIKFNKDDGTTQYKFNDKNKNCDSHLHMQCLKCGKIEHLDCNEFSLFSKHISNHHGFNLNFSKSILYGVCSDCENR